MKKRDDREYLLHIADAINKIQTYTSGFSEEHFRQNTLVQDAVIRQFEIIGEAAKNLSHQVKQKTAHIPWKAIAGTRDVLIHQYFGVDIGAIWQYVTEDLPSLKTEVQGLLK